MLSNPPYGTSWMSDLGRIWVASASGETRGVSLSMEAILNTR